MHNEHYRREYTKEFVSRWDKLIGWDSRAASENGFFHGLLHKHNCRSVADVAAGTGFHAVMLARQGFDVTATDGAAEMVEKTRANAVAHGIDLVDIREADWRDLHRVFSPNSFDALVCLGNAFTHLFEEQARRDALEAMFEVVRPGGLVVIDQRNYDKILDQGYSSKSRYYYVGDGVSARPVEIDDSKVRFEYSYADGNKFHLTMFPLRQNYLTRLLEEAGFRDIERYGDFEPNYDFDDVDFVQQVAFKPRP